MKLYAHRVDGSFNLGDVDPEEKGPFDGKNDPRVQEKLKEYLDELVDLQTRLYAERKRGVLVVLQAMDTGGKDGLLRKVVGPLDSRGVHVADFKAPSTEERAHDFLWRIHAQTPRKGHMVFFNRSHYEDVLIVRVMDLVPKSVWHERYDHIAAFERLLTDEGTCVVKLLLHISKDEQKRRLQERLDDPDKRWKFDPADLAMRARWDDFMAAYQEALRKTSTDDAPWYVIPANRKWFRNYAMSTILRRTLEKLDLKFPDAPPGLDKIVVE